MKKKLILSVIGICIVFAAVGFAAYRQILSDLPEVTQLESCFKGSMNNVSVCPSSASYVKLTDVSKTFLDALVASEDASFWFHEGIDWFEVKESFKQNLSAGSFRRGGSTISQQLVKNAFLSPEKSLLRKFREVLLTRKMESTYSKEFILEKYLNIIELGPDLFGLNEAARFYFYKSPDQLNLLESAYLVHLLPSPKKYSQTFQKGELTEFSKKMILLICKRLLFYKKISQAEFEFAHGNLDKFPWYGVSGSPIEWDGVDDLESAEDELDQLIMESEAEEEQAEDDLDEANPPEAFDE